MQNLNNQEFSKNLDKIFKQITNYSEMSINEQYFLNNVICSIYPNKVLELGVSSGGGTSIILNAINDNAKLYSVDYLEYAYGYPTKPSGFIIEEMFPEFKNKWEIYRGADVSHFIEQIGNDIDIAVIDTMHIHPWESLNFLCVLPYMKIGSWVILHDISAQCAFPKKIACKYLWGHVVSEHKISPVPDNASFFANIGAFQITEDTYKYIEDIFMSLSIAWGADVKAKDIDDIRKIIKKHYSDHFNEVFENSVKIQAKIKINYATQGHIKNINFFFRTKFPKLFNVLKSIKRNFNRKKSRK